MRTKRIGSRCALKKTLLAAGLLTALGTNFSYAQIITGGLYGTEPAAAGAAVIVTNSATGYRKEVQVDKTGRYSLDGLNPGIYTVTVSRDGKEVGSRNVLVKTNNNSPVPAISVAAETTSATAGNAAELAGIEVTAASRVVDIAPIDVSTPTFLNHYDMQIVNQLPTGRGMESIALLRSNVVYDDQTTKLAVLGGTSPAENRYFFNGFDTTNEFMKSGPGANRLPPEALQGVDVISSAGSASWTNVTGGLMAATVRQGTNEYKGGYSLYITPPTSSLQPASPNSYYTDANGKQQYYRYYSDNRHNTEVEQYLWGSGPIIKDTLFLFAMIGNKPNWQSTSYTVNRAYDTTDRDKNGMVNLTWNISSDQTFDVVASKDVKTNFNNLYALNQNYTPSSIGAYKGWVRGYAGSNNATDKFLIGNYTWHINDKMSLVVMGGYLSDSQYNPTSSSGTGLPYVTEVDPITQQTSNIGISNTSLQTFPQDYWKRGFNAKLNWELGDHKISFGAEHYHHFVDSHGNTTTDGGVWTYYTKPGTVLPNGTPVPADGRYVQEYFEREGGSFNTVNKGAFLEDYWQVSDRWVIYLSTRFDEYANKDANNNNFMRLPLLSPRIGAAWDVHGDSSTKLGANLGKYGLAIPSAVNAGVGSASYIWNRWYTYTGRDPVTQAPTGLTQLGPQQTVLGGDGAVQPYYTLASSNIKAPYQYELQVYWQQALQNSWSFNLEGGFSQLKRIVDDTNWSDGITAYANAHGYPNYVDNTFPMINPGYAQLITRDYNGDGKLESLLFPADYFGPKAKRNYAHITFEMMHARTDDEPYVLDVSYTWSHLYGNDDGYLSLSQRVGGGVAQQPLWDFPSMMDYSNGPLAMDTRHKLNLNGVYYFSTGFRASGILNMSTGHPLSCFGSYPDPNNEANYDGPLSHYCNNQPAPAGTAGRTPFYWTLALGAGYDWKIGDKNHFSVDLQMQNVTNRKGVIDRFQQFDTGNQLNNGYWERDLRYGTALYQAPRSTTLVFRYSYE